MLDVARTVAMRARRQNPVDGVFSLRLFSTERQRTLSLSGTLETLAALRHHGHDPHQCDCAACHAWRASLGVPRIRPAAADPRQQRLF